MEFIEKIEKEPSILKKLSAVELDRLSAEIRQVIIETVSANGGHLSSNLGIVELTVSLHKTFTLPPDKIIWDVGHQCYPHKLLTGRLKSFSSLRQHGGLTGYPCPEESLTDIFKTGHAGTAISSATGIKTAQDLMKEKGKVIAVIGDGSLTNGITFEGLNFLGSLSKNLLVILNDNKMSISSTKGALSYYLAKLITSPLVNKPKTEFVEILRSIPSVGKDILRVAQDIETKTKHLFIPGVFFEKIGLRYFGPIDGHDFKQLLDILHNIKDIEAPVLLHVVTKKGKGYRPAEENPADFHSAAPFLKQNGSFIKKPAPSPGTIAGEFLEEAAAKGENLVVLTAAMEKGLGLEGFAAKYPDKFFDVGIAESHCILFAAGLAKAGMKVAVAIYSTFLQRGYDQILHDICLQKLPVIFLVDRAGLVGEDGPTHHGMFDLSFLRTIPGLKVFAPYSITNLKKVLENSLLAEEPVFIRFPKGLLPDSLEPFDNGGKTLVLGCGSMGINSLQACKTLAEENHKITFFPVCGVNPLEKHVLEAIGRFDRIVTVEENSIAGGFGSAVSEYISDSMQEKKLLRLGLPATFIEQGERTSLLDRYGLSPEKIAGKIRPFSVKGQAG